MAVGETFLRCPVAQPDREFQAFERVHADNADRGVADDQRLAAGAMLPHQRQRRMADPEPALEGGVARFRLDAELRAGQRMYRTQTLERLLAIFGQRLVGGVGIAEFRIAAARRRSFAAEQRAQDRHLVEIAVEMPEERSLGVFRDDAGGGVDGDRGGGAVGMIGGIFAESTGEGDLLRLGKMHLREDQDAALFQQLADRARMAATEQRRLLGLEYSADPLLELAIGEAVFFHDRQSYTSGSQGRSDAGTGIDMSSASCAALLPNGSRHRLTVQPPSSAPLSRKFSAWLPGR